MGKGRDRRRDKRRQRAQAPRPPDPLPKPVDVDRTAARFRSLIGRGVTLGFLAWGPVVNADTPEEVVEAVAAAIAAECGKQRPS